MSDDWDKVEDAALKVLGDGGGVPEFDVPLKAFASFTDDVRDKLVPAADKVSAAIFTLQQNASARVESWEELQDRVDASDLGLNAKKTRRTYARSRMRRSCSMASSRNRWPRPTPR